MSKIKQPSFRSPFSLKNNLFRVLWILLGSALFRLSFHNFYGYRNFILRLFGAKIGKNVRLRRSVKIEMPWKLSIGKHSAIGDFAILYNQSPIRIGSCVTVSQYAHLCTGSHDYSDPKFEHFSKPITIDTYAWVAANAFVGPGVKIAEGAILGACGVAMKDLEAWKIYAGNPAKVVGERPKAKFSHAS